MSRIGFFIIAIFFFVTSSSAPNSPWQNLAPGLDYAKFNTPKSGALIDTSITIIRVDPDNWDFKLLAASNTESKKSMNSKEWCQKHKLTASINAGMFATDLSTHVGYMKSGKHVNSSKINSYKSALAFQPKVKGEQSVKIFDLDQDDMSSIRKKYDCVAQNLRLIKRPGVNCWGQQNKKWSEAAIGEDKNGRILFIFCRAPYSMHDFNNILLSLPINLVCAQHLEGGPEAQLYLKVDDFEINLNGSYETGFNENNAIRQSWPIPNVIGIVPSKN